MIRKLSLLLGGALMGATAMSLVYGMPSTSANAAGSETYKQLAIFGDIFERVRAQYVTPPEEKALVESAINGMLTSLDPHSSYLNPEAAKDMRVQTKGEFGGLGCQCVLHCRSDGFQSREYVLRSKLPVDTGASDPNS